MADSTSPRKRTAVGRFLQTMWSRITESHYTILFVFLSLIQFILVFVLEYYVFGLNSTQFEILEIGIVEFLQIPPYGSAMNQAGSTDFSNRALKFGEMLLEGAFYIVFAFWLLLFGIDAIVRQNTMQLLAFLAAELLALILVIVELAESFFERSKIISLEAQYNVTINLDSMAVARNFDFGLIASLFVFTVAFTYLVYRLYRQFGWNIYKRIGADLTMQYMYRTYELFIMSLKLSFFFQIFFNIFWIVLVVESLLGLSGPKTYLGLHCVLTFLNITNMVIGAWGARKERPLAMLFYMFVNVLMIANFIYIMYSFGTEWIMWDFAIILAIIQSIANTALAYFVTQNFGRGLKSNLRSLSSKKNEPINLRETKDWAIEEDEAVGPSSHQVNNSGKWAIEDEDELVGYQQNQGVYNGYNGGGVVDGTTQGALGY